MIAIVLPYWNRREVARRCIERLIALYSNLPIELIVVNDGSPEPPEIPQVPRMWCHEVIESDSRHEAPRNPCVPYNVGVRAAVSDYVVLSGCDIWHEEPILERMLESVRSGPLVYVTAAARRPRSDGSQWDAHSSRDLSKITHGVPMPPRAQFHFCAMLRRRGLWLDAGGFDEDYRDGAGYEDADWIKRLERAGAQFIPRDDLVVDHVRDGAHSPWASHQFTRNREIFTQKWSR